MRRLNFKTRKTIRKIVLILILLLVIPWSIVNAVRAIKKYIYENETETIVGEIAYILDSSSTYALYLKMPNDVGNDNLVAFRITPDTELEFGTYESIADAEDFQIGQTVEITYTKKNFISDQYIAKTLRSTNSDHIMTQDTTFEMSEDYRAFFSYPFDIGEVVYVSKMTYPIEGYILYLKYGGIVKGYFVDSITYIPDDIRTAIENGETGYEIKVHYVRTFPYTEYYYYYVVDIERYNKYK